MKASVRSGPGARPGAVLASELRSASTAARAAIGSKASVTRRLRRQKRGIQPSEPSTLQDIDLPDEYQTTGEAVPEPFLIHDSGPTSDKRMLVFASKEQLRHLSASDRLVRHCIPCN